MGGAEDAFLRRRHMRDSETITARTTDGGKEERKDIFFTETHVGDNGHVFVHMKLIPSSNSFAVCFRNFNILAIQRVNVLQTVDPRAFKTSQGIPSGAPLSGSAAVGAAQ